MLKILKNFSKKEWALVLTAVVLIFISVWAELSMPEYMSEITRLDQTEGSKMIDIITAGGKMLIYALISLLATVCTAGWSSSVASRLSANIRSKLFRKVQSFSMGEIGHFSTASLITRTTNDVIQVHMLIV